MNKEGGMKSGSLCALLWKILTWCTSKLVTLKARHIPGRLNMVADKTRPDNSNRAVSPFRGLLGNMQQVAPTSNRPFCDEVQQQTRPIYVTSASGQSMHSACPGGAGSLCLPTSSHLGQGGEKLKDYQCRRIILIAQGWPNMPWFWDLVVMSSQIPLSLPNLPLSHSTRLLKGICQT